MSKAVVRVLLREVNLHLRARACGLVEPRSGAVAIVQRFGGAFNLNVSTSTRLCSTTTGIGMSACVATPCAHR